MKLRAAEFFAGIGLVRAALELEGVEVVWANDIHPVKAAVYRENYGDAHLVVGDVRTVRGAQLPPAELATASFPCTDLSLAGNRSGLGGAESSAFFEFVRVLGEQGRARPGAVLVENVPALASSRRGADLAEVVAALNSLGYSCDLAVLDARRFLPQSRPRLFIVGARTPPPPSRPSPTSPDWLRPPWVGDFAARFLGLALHFSALEAPPPSVGRLGDCVERLAGEDPRWWDPARTARFTASLSPLHARRLAALAAGERRTWRSAYRRTRNGAATWEIRADALAGCLRTARGGSSKQALVEAGRGEVRVRWMTALEYARLQGAPAHRRASVSENQALFGFGDAVCVPAVAWVVRRLVRPALLEQHPQAS
ncbi:MAG: DNA cytosine methyltransferase [Acidimicrobiales bacterium]